MHHRVCNQSACTRCVETGFTISMTQKVQLCQARAVPMGATCNKPVKIPFPSCAGSKTDVCYVGQVSYRETGMKEDTVSDVRQEMAERHQAGCLTMGGRTERKDTGRHSHANWTGKNHAATLSCDYAIVTTKSNQSTRVLKKKCHLSKKKKNATDCNCSIYFSTLYHGCQHTPFSCNRPLRLALVLHTGVWQKSSASSSGNPQPVP